MARLSTNISLPILTFHAIDDRPSVISFPQGLFRRGMARLYDRGYRTLSLLEAADRLRQGKPFPERSFVITFDDGYKSVFDEAFPVLRQYKMIATVFLAVRQKRVSGHNVRLPSLEGRQMLSWEEIREMRRYGLEFGAHTLTHLDLTRLSLEQAKFETYESKAMIEYALNIPVTSFAYPYGRYNDQSREIVRSRFACACSDMLGLANSNSDLYALERVEAYYLRSERLFEENFPATNIEVKTYGNVLTAIAFLHGLGAEELSSEELNYFDPDYEVLIAVRALNPKEI